MCRVLCSLFPSICVFLYHVGCVILTRLVEDNVKQKKKKKKDSQNLVQPSHPTASEMSLSMSHQPHATPGLASPVPSIAARPSNICPETPPVNHSSCLAISHRLCCSIASCLISSPLSARMPAHGSACARVLALKVASSRAPVAAAVPTSADRARPHNEARHADGFQHEARRPPLVEQRIGHTPSGRGPLAPLALEHVLERQVL